MPEQEMTMPEPTIQETRILPKPDEHTMVEIVLADHPEEAAATFHARFRCVLAPQKEFAKRPLLLQVQRLALFALREAADAEMTRISGP